MTASEQLLAEEEQAAARAAAKKAKKRKQKAKKQDSKAQQAPAQQQAVQTGVAASASGLRSFKSYKNAVHGDTSQSCAKLPTDCLQPLDHVWSQAPRDTDTTNQCCTCELLHRVYETCLTMTLYRPCLSASDEPSKPGDQTWSTCLFC